MSKVLNGSLGIAETGDRKLLLKPREAASILGISPRKLWSLTAGGELSAVRIGRAVRYGLPDLESFVDSRRKASQGVRV